MAKCRITVGLFCAVAVMLCSGCFFRRDSISCEDPALYGSSRSVPPMRVPDGFDVPDESDAMQIPPGEPLVVGDVDEMIDCLENPPDFFDESEETAPQ